MFEWSVIQVIIEQHYCWQHKLLLTTFIFGKIPWYHTSFHVRDPISMLHEIPSRDRNCEWQDSTVSYIISCTYKHASRYTNFEQHVHASYTPLYFYTIHACATFMVQFIGVYKACFQHPLLKLSCANIKTLHVPMLFQSQLFHCQLHNNHKWKSCGSFTRLKHCCFRLFLLLHID